MTDEQFSLPFTLMRGGTSKAVFLRGADLPPPGADRDRVILALFGSPDPRQIDGLGGADILTSKLAIIDPPSRPDVDLDYTFAQVSVSEPVVDFDIICGNISSAVGAYAVDEGMAPADEPSTTVRIYNTNTDRIFRAIVPVREGRAAIEGDCTIDGVPGTGAPIALDLSGTFGSETGVLLPTGNSLDVLETAIGSVEVSIVDLASLCVFFRATAVGLEGTEGPDAVTEDHVAAVVAIKEATSKLLGLPLDALTPIPAAVAAPTDYVSFGKGKRLAASEVDLVARVIGGRPPMLHKAYPGATAACTAVAARIPGTTVAQVAEQRDAGTLRIGHTSGVMAVGVAVDRDGDGWRVGRASYDRTARRLAEGTAFVRRAAAGPDS
ncbi:MAG: PrpF domain-containing protein [Acidimicrobiia bacterium]